MRKAGSKFWYKLAIALDRAAREYHTLSAFATTAKIARALAVLAELREAKK